MVNKHFPQVTVTDFRQMYSTIQLDVDVDHNSMAQHNKETAQTYYDLKSYERCENEVAKAGEASKVHSIGKRMPDNTDHESHAQNLEQIVHG